MPESMTPEDAIRTLTELKSAQQSMGATLAQKDEAISDLKAAVKSLTEAQHRAEQGDAERRIYGGDEYGLKEYVEERDGVKFVRSKGGVDPETGEYRDGLLDTVRGDDGHPIVHGAWHAKLLDLVSDLNHIRAIKRDPRHPERTPSVPGVERKIRAHLSRAPDEYRKIFADASGSGAEWIPDDTLPRYERDLLLRRSLADIFPSVQVQRDTTYLPYLSTGGRPYITGAVTTNDPSQLTTSSLATTNRTFTSKTWAIRFQVDADASEDSLIAWEPIHRQEAVAGVVDGYEDAIVNGDTAATHEDAIASWDIASRWGTDGLGTTADHRRAFIGLRARAFDIGNTTDQGSAKTTAGYLAARANLAGGYSAASDLVVVPSYAYYVGTMLGLAEVLTMEKYGQMATIVQGELARFAGTPIVLSDFMSSDLNASGLYDNTTKTQSGMLIFNRSRFVRIQRRGGMLEAAKDITRQVTDIVYTVRQSFATIDSATKANVHFSFNL